jgi:hypothetical protein
LITCVWGGVVCRCPAMWEAVGHGRGCHRRWEAIFIQYLEMRQPTELVEPWPILRLKGRSRINSKSFSDTQDPSPLHLQDFFSQGHKLLLFLNCLPHPLFPDEGGSARRIPTAGNGGRQNRWVCSIQSTNPAISLRRGT